MIQKIREIQQILRTHSGALTQAYHVRRFGVFGSYSRGTQTTTSDIDMLVEFSEPISLFQFVELEQKLSDLLHRNIDLVTPGALKSVMRAEVQKQVVYV